MLRYERYRARKRMPKDLQTKVIQKKLGINEIMEICVAYSAFLSLIILTEKYLMYNKYITLLSVSAFVIIVTFFALAFRLADMLLIIKNSILYTVVTTIIYFLFEASVLIYVIPVFKYIYKTL